MAELAILAVCVVAAIVLYRWGVRTERTAMGRAMAGWFYWKLRELVAAAPDERDERLQELLRKCERILPLGGHTNLDRAIEFVRVEFPVPGIDLLPPESMRKDRRDM